MLSEYTNRLWVLQSWFVSISMALLTAAYFIGRKLSLAQLVFILVTYLLYFIAILRNLGRIVTNLQAAIDSLRELTTQEIELSRLAQQLFGNYESGESILMVLLLDFGFSFLLFFGVIGYLLHQHIRGKRTNVQG